MQKIKKAFTLIELITVIVIIVVLSSAGFFLISKLMKNGRDSKRYADANTIATALQGYFFVHKDYPDPSDKIKILDQSGTLIGYQGILDQSVMANGLDMTKLPVDPSDKNLYYSYVKAINPWEDKKGYEVGTVIESYREKDNGEKIYRGKYVTPYIISSNTISTCEEGEKLTYPSKISVINYETNEYARKTNLPQGEVYLDLLNLKGSCQGEVVANIIGLTGWTIPEPDVKTCPTGFFFNGEYCQIKCDESNYSKEINGKCYSWTGSASTGYIFQTKDGLYNLYPLNCKDLIDKKDIFSIYDSITYAGSSDSKYTDGMYWLDVDGTGATAPLKLYCDMNTDKGGWTRLANASYNTKVSDYNINNLGIPHTQVYIKDMGSYSDYHTPINPYMNWQGFHMFYNCIKLSDGYRYLHPSGTNTLTTNPYQFKKLPDGSWKTWGEPSQCYFLYSNYPKRCFKNGIINLPAGLKFVGYTDGESSPGGYQQGDNYFAIRMWFFVR